MFNSKKEQVVPVYTVHTVPRSYELIDTVYCFGTNLTKKLDPIHELGVEGAKLGADAVIGLVSGAGAGMRYWGTAIRYLD
jgi:hypothetical protein